MVETFNIHEAKTNLSRLIEMAEAGEQVVIARAGKPVAVLGKYTDAPMKPRKPGSLKGKIWYADDWDSAETNEDIAKTFYESMGIDYAEIPVIDKKNETSS